WKEPASACAQGRTTSATRWPSAPSLTGSGQARTSTGGCPSSLRSSATSNPSRPTAGADGADRRPSAAPAGGAGMTLLAPTLQAFFTERMITQRDASPQTIAAYRDTFRLLLTFASKQTGKQPFQLDIDDLDAELIGAFLNHLETDRGNCPRTRNAR